MPVSPRELAPVWSKIACGLFVEHILGIYVVVSFASSEWLREKTRVLPWSCLLLNEIDLLGFDYVAWGLSGHLQL